MGKKNKCIAREQSSAKSKRHKKYKMIQRPVRILPATIKYYSSPNNPLRATNVSALGYPTASKSTDVVPEAIPVKVEEPKTRALPVASKYSLYPFKTEGLGAYANHDPSKASAKKAEDEALAKKKAEEEAAAKKRAEAEEAAKKKKAKEEAAAKKKAEEEAAAKKKAEEEVAAKKKAEEEAAAKKKAEEEALAKKKAEEEAAAKKKAEEEAARLKAEQKAAAKKKAEEEAAL